MDEVIPIGRAKNDAESPGRAEEGVGAEIALARAPQEPVKLVDRHHGGRRIVDCRGECLDRDVDQDAEREQRILLQRALGAKDDAAAQRLFIDRLRTTMEQEERLIGSNEISDLRRKLDYPVRLLRLGDELWHIHREDDAGRAVVQDRALHRTGILRPSRGSGRAREFLGINTLDHGMSIVSDALHEADRTQQARGVINEKQKGCQTGETEQTAEKSGKLRDARLEVIQCPDAKKKSKDKQADGVADDVVPQQRSRDDARRVLPAGDLDCHQQRTEREDK